MFRAAATILIFLLATSFAHAQREFRSSTRFEPPPESFHAPDSLRVLEEQLKRGQFVESATAIDALLRDNASAITPINERESMSVENWLDVTVARYLKDFTPIYSAQFDEAAKKALDELLDQS